MIKQKLTALALILPLTAVALSGFADEEEPKQDESNKSERVLNLQSLLAKNEDSNTAEESSEDEKPSTEQNRCFERV
ncbi:hypothetical protein [Endozoicomonas sp. 8E]|uniref:hypothetical protein n=1 Tax=Endozoicomonas sp. 8E TaxID=3035692 RepID=UPI0029393057|nr:hypothetical protein [Endozoicomonas sp. 8E]WOG25594.1 hypothetical protein P6910_13470 [Endozoicomonas sp. 8E]